jgi:hypothetical protein
MSSKNINNLLPSATSGSLVSSLAANAMGTEDHVVRFANSGTVIQDSVVTLTDSGLFTGAQGLQLLQQSSNPGSLPTYWAEIGNFPNFGENPLVANTGGIPSVPGDIVVFNDANSGVTDSGVSLSSLATITTQTITPVMVSNPAGSTATITITFTKIGKLVNCDIASKIGTITGVLSFVGTGIIPAAFTPRAVYESPFNAFVSGNFDPGASGSVIVDISNNLQIRRDCSLTQTWPGATCGWDSISLNWLTF